MRELFFSTHSSSSRASFRNSLLGISANKINDNSLNNSFRLEGLDEEGDDESMNLEDETSLEFAEVAVSEYDENQIAFTRNYNRKHGNGGGTENAPGHTTAGGNDMLMDFDTPFSSISDLQATQQLMGMSSGFFDAIEEQYLEAIESSTIHSKKSSSIRFADEVEPIYDVEPSGKTNNDLMPFTDRKLDVYHLGFFGGATASAAGLPAAAHLIDDDDSSIYEELPGDGDSDDEDSQENPEKRIVRGFLYGVGGVALFAGVGFLAKQAMNMLSKGGDDDINGGANGGEFYHGADQAAAAAGDAAHGGESAADAAQAIETLGEASNASLQSSTTLSVSQSSSLSVVGPAGANGAVEGSATTKTLQHMSVSAASSAGNR